MRLEIAAENAVILYSEEAELQTANQVVQSWYQALLPLRDGELIQRLIPAYRSVLIEFPQIIQSFEETRTWLFDLLTQAERSSVVTLPQPKYIELPVCYEAGLDFDLSRLADAKGLSIEQVISLHSEVDYQVFAIGFAPGFAYLGEVAKALHMPRLETPRKRVPAGAVAIADNQTAVYPAASPGGWNIIGLCPTPLFTPEQSPPMPFSVGDRIRFIPISASQFLNMGGQWYE